MQVTPPVLYTKGKNGELRQWQVFTEGDQVIVEHGVVGGALTHQARTAVPKNVGRSNATTAEQQATVEAEAAYKFKLDRKYSTTLEAAQDVVPLPMLAKPFVAKKVTFPVDVQPKLDGVRCIARWSGDEIDMISRSGKPFGAPVDHIREALKGLLPKDSEFDGELYVHGKPFQWITSRTKKAHEDSNQLQYHVYDFPTVHGDDSLPWITRHDRLLDWLQDGDDVVRPVFTLVARDEKRVDELHDIFVKDGYEGAIIRLPHGVYEYAHRSSNLLKLKSFDDNEFNIVGYTEGEGTEKGLVLWVCSMPDGIRKFTTRPKGIHEDRAYLFQHGADYIGQKLRVKHFGWTDDNLPRFPIGEGIRIEEDMD